MNPICKNCKKPIKIPGIYDSNNITFNGTKIQCPNCGTVNEIPSGSYDFDKNGNVTRFTPNK